MQAEAEERKRAREGEKNKSFVKQRGVVGGSSCSQRALLTRCSLHSGHEQTKRIFSTEGTRNVSHHTWLEGFYVAEKIRREVPDFDLFKSHALRPVQKSCASNLWPTLLNVWAKLRPLPQMHQTSARVCLCYAIACA